MAVWGAEWTGLVATSLGVPLVSALGQAAWKPPAPTSTPGYVCEQLRVLGVPRACLCKADLPVAAAP